MISEQKKCTIAIIKQIQMKQEDLPDNYPILPCPRCGGEWLLGGVIYLFYKLAEDVIQTKRKRD